MEKNKRIIVLIIFLLIAAIVIILSAVSKKKNQNYIINEYNNVKYNNNGIAPMNEVQTTDENELKVKQEYLDSIRNDQALNTHKIDDYKINEITILSDEEKSKIIQLFGSDFYKETDTFAYITYSIKPNDLDNSILNIGTGVQNGDWITFENVNVCIRDGKVISAGTSW